MKKLPSLHIKIHSILAVATLLNMPLYAAEPDAMKMPKGAYADTYNNGATVCATNEALGLLSWTGWKEKMGQLRRECSLTEPNQGSSFHEYWKAECTIAAGETTKDNYRINISSMRGVLVIDSMIDTPAGKLKLKKSFRGEYKGACNSTMPLLDAWSYLDLPAPLPTSDLKVRKLVAADMIRCGNVFYGLTLVVAKEKRADMMNTGKAIWGSALELIDYDNDFYLSELKKSGTEVSVALVPLPSVEKLNEMVQACNKYTAPEGIAIALKEQAAGSQK